MKPVLKFALFISAFVLCNGVYAQISDSLYKALPVTIKLANPGALSTKDLKTLLDSSKNTLPQKYFPELSMLARRFGAAAEKSTNKDEKIKNTMAVAQFYWDWNNTNGLEYLQKIVGYCGNESKYAGLMGRVYTIMGDQYMTKHFTDSTIQFCYKGLDICTQYQDTVFMLQACNDLCDTYNRLNLFDKVVYYSNKALALTNQKWSDNYIYNIFFKMRGYRGWYEKTRNQSYADSVITIAKNIFKYTHNDSMYWYGSTYLILGQLYYNVGNYRQALNYYDSSLMNEYREKDKYYDIKRVGIKYFIRNLCLIRMGQTGLAKALIDSVGVTDYYSQRRIYDALYNYAVDVKDWKNAFLYYKQYNLNVDSAKAIETNGLLFETEQRYAVAEKQAQITALENKGLLREKQQSKLLTTGIAAGLVLLLAIAILTGMYRYAQVKRHSEKQLLTAELYSMESAIHEERQQQLENIIAQRKKIAEDMHDEVSSGLAAFRFYIIDLKARAKSAETTAMLSELEGEAQVLYQQARNFMKNLNASKPSDSYNVYELAEQLSARFNNEEVLMIKNNIDRRGVEQYFTGSMHYELYLVIKEAIANSIKHAGASLVDIGIYFKNHTCFFAINDNGKGFNVETASSDGLGLKSISNRIQTIRGNLQIRSNSNGTVIEGFFPV